MDRILEEIKDTAELINDMIKDFDFTKAIEEEMFEKTKEDIFSWTKW